MLLLRKAEAQDAPLIHSLAKQVFPLTYQDILSPEQNEYMFEWMYAVETLRQEMSAGLRYFILENQGQACGYMCIEQQAPALFCLQKIYILPGCQKTGAGRFMFQQALSYIKSISPDPCRMELRVNRKNPAVQFYQKMGMRILRSDDLEISPGYFMKDYILGIDLA